MIIRRWWLGSNGLYIINKVTTISLPTTLLEVKDGAISRAISSLNAIKVLYIVLLPQLETAINIWHNSTFLFFQYQWAHYPWLDKILSFLYIVFWSKQEMISAHCRTHGNPLFVSLLFLQEQQFFAFYTCAFNNLFSLWSVEITIASNSCWHL